MRHSIFVISDATGETAYRMTMSALSQFPGVEVTVRRFGEVRDAKSLRPILEEAAATRATVMYTFVSDELRTTMADELAHHGLAGLDLIGPVLERLEGVFSREASALPGNQYRVDAAYQQRVAAIEYTVKHDDGAGLRTIGRADVVLVGPSRTGKTPISMFLANAGYRVANIPFIAGQPLAFHPESKASYLVVGLVANSETLVRFREERIRQVGSNVQQSRYAEPDVIADELAVARELYAREGWPVIDVSDRAVEEIAAEIVTLIERRALQQRKDVTP